MAAKVRRRVRFRPPGVKPGGKVGPWGPFRGRLGAHWWIGALVVGALLLVAGWLILVPGSRPGPEWKPVGHVDRFEPGGVPVDVGAGVFVARLTDGRPAAVAADPGCPLDPKPGGYADCRGASYDATGEPAEDGAALTRVPVLVYRTTVFVNPSAASP